MDVNDQVLVYHIMYGNNPLLKAKKLLGYDYVNHILWSSFPKILSFSHDVWRENLLLFGADSFSRIINVPQVSTAQLAL